MNRLSAENVGHPTRDRHLRNALRVSAGAALGMGNEGVFEEMNNSRLASREFIRSNSPPAVVRCLIERQMPAIPETSKRRIDAAGLCDLVTEIIKFIWIRKDNLL